MSKRKIINIDETKCNGCGSCIPNCPEGALQIIDGKARLISDLFCDGLGACIGHCPLGAIYIEERVAEKYDESKVMANIVKQGKNVMIAHLLHLKDHNESEYLKEAIKYLEENNLENPLKENEGIRSMHAHGFSPCPGSKAMDFRKKDVSSAPIDEKIDVKSKLRQWPVQLHLVNPGASYFKNADVVLSADCVAYALGNFHTGFLKGKSLAIACPKLDEGLEIYEEKIIQLIDDAKINTITVMIMEVPCCGGLLNLAKSAASRAKRKIPVKAIVVSIEGEILSEEWV